MSQESYTELDTTTPATVSSEPCTTSTESPTTVSGAANETPISSEAPSEPTDKATNNNSPTETARTYPKRSRNPVATFEPTW